MRGVRRLVTSALACLAVWSAFGKQAAVTITAEEAESLVRVVLRHQNIHLSPAYCELKTLDEKAKPFVPDYYSFGASCDYPNTAATIPFGIYLVSPRTGEVWEFDRCKWFRFPELRRLQQNIMHRTHATETTEAKYRKQTDCD